jgi:hypothetical protein
MTTSLRATLHCAASPGAASLRALLCALLTLAACHTEPTGGVSAATAPDPAGSLPAGSLAGSGSSAAPRDRLCLPAMICLEWAGCALVAPNGTGKGTVISADRLKPGEPVRLDNGCNNGATCPAAKAAPRDVTCPPIEIPPVLGPPSYRCVLDGDRCRER